MRPLVFLLLFGAVLGPFASAQAQPASQQDEGAIRGVIASFPDTWNRHDMTAMARLFAEEAVFVVVTGKLLSGRADIERYHAELQKTAYKDSHLTWNPVKVRLVRPDVAIAHVATEITYQADKRTSVAILVFSKHDRDWLIEALQNTLTSGPAVAPAGSVSPR
jgi:uncharacterized protein (TIGR02246 family)